MSVVCPSDGWHSQLGKEPKSGDGRNCEETVVSRKKAAKERGHLPHSSGAMKSAFGNRK
jgi:hypothetical protein